MAKTIPNLKVGKTVTKPAINYEVKPFQNPTMEIIGLVIMIILMILSTAGGLSGAGSNIPLMLIFFKMPMEVAVPISSFVGVVSTLFRFVLNFSKRHPYFDNVDPDNKDKRATDEKYKDL